MHRGMTGHFDVRGEGIEPVHAFVPKPLPPAPPLDLSGAVSRLLDASHVACGRLDGVSLLLPDPDLFLYFYVRREAVLSSQIEGTQSSLSDLLLFDTLFEAKVLIERWRRHYNTVRPHSALGYRPPAPEAWQPCAAASATPQRPHRAGLSEDQPLT